MGTDYSLRFLLSKRHHRRQRPIESAGVRLCEAESNEEAGRGFLRFSRSITCYRIRSRTHVERRGLGRWELFSADELGNVQ